MALTVLLACLVLLGWALLTWRAQAATTTTDLGPSAAGTSVASLSSDRVPASPASAGTGASRTPAPADVGPVSTSPPSGTQLPRPAVVPADLGTSRAATQASAARSGALAPQRVTIGSVGIDTPVDPVGVAEDGQLEIPEEAARTGWYRFGPAPGQDGSAVLAGHVDDWLGRPGGLAALHDVEPGAQVEVTHADGSRTAYRVVSRTSVAKAELDLKGLFRRDGDPVLVLVTCTGAWTGDHYQDNLVVTAVPSER